MSARIGWQTHWDETKARIRRIGRLLTQGTLQQRVLLWIGLASLVISAILMLQELWRALPAVLGIVLIQLALRNRGAA